MKSLAKRLAFTAVFAALCCVSTLLISVPLPYGYFNTGDVFVLLSGWFLGPLYGSVAAALGSALADLFSGYALYAPVTFFIKGLDASLAWLVAWAVKKVCTKDTLDFIARIFGALAGELLMIFGYFLFESVLYGFAGGVATLVGNSLQGLCCSVLAVLLFASLYPIQAVRKFFDL